MAGLAGLGTEDTTEAAGLFDETSDDGPETPETFGTEAEGYSAFSGKGTESSGERDTGNGWVWEGTSGDVDNGRDAESSFKGERGGDGDLFMFSIEPIIVSDSGSFGFSRLIG